MGARSSTPSGAEQQDDGLPAAPWATARTVLVHYLEKGRGGFAPSTTVLDYSGPAGFHAALERLQQQYPAQAINQINVSTSHALLAGADERRRDPTQAAAVDALASNVGAWRP